jgi:hypothetical protein
LKFGGIRDSKSTVAGSRVVASSTVSAQTALAGMPSMWHTVEAGIISTEILTQGGSPVYEKECIRKDGTVFPVELRTFVLRGKDGKPEAM